MARFYQVATSFHRFTGFQMKSKAQTFHQMLQIVGELKSVRVSAMQSAKGASIYDVRTEGGGGVSPIEDVVREVT